MPLRTDDAQKLISMNKALLRRMGDLAIDAATVATALASRGAPAPESFVHDVAEVGCLFTALRAETFAAASSLDLPLPPLDAVNSAIDLEAMLDALLTSVGAAERRAAIAAERAAALNVLERVALLTHADDADFEPLRTCQQRGRTLRAALEPTAEPDVAAVAPFAALLHFIGSHHVLDDEQWGVLQETVRGAFGAQLAMAAGRGRLLAGMPAQP
jgi:hypothetical protein